MSFSFKVTFMCFIGEARTKGSFPLGEFKENNNFRVFHEDDDDDDGDDNIGMIGTISSVRDLHSYDLKGCTFSPKKGRKFARQVSAPKSRFQLQIFPNFCLFKSFFFALDLLTLSAIST